MAMRTLLRQLRSKAPSLAQRISGDCLEGVSPFRSPELTLGRRTLMYNVTIQTTNEDTTLFLQRGYSSESSSVDTDNGCSTLSTTEEKNISEPSLVDADNDCSTLSTTEEKNSPNDYTADGLDSDNLGPKISERHNLAMIYTCNVCQTRSAKTMSRQTYETGVVIVRCGGCKSLHLIADHLGWFGEPGSVEDFLKQKGVEIRKGTEETYEFSADDLTGWSPPTKK